MVQPSRVEGERNISSAFTMVGFFRYNQSDTNFADAINQRRHKPNRSQPPHALRPLHPHSSTRVGYSYTNINCSEPITNSYSYSNENNDCHSRAFIREQPHHYAVSAPLDDNLYHC